MLGFDTTALLLTGLAMLGPNTTGSPLDQAQPLKGVRITIDPGHGFSAAYDSFRVGPSGEREEWINLRVAKSLFHKLKSAGAIVYLTRDSDRDLSLAGRAALTRLHKSDLLISIHHNGSPVDDQLDFPIVYFWGSALDNPASVDLAHVLLHSMKKNMHFEQKDAGAVYSDHLIYDNGTSLLRNTVDFVPGIIGEGGFFTSKQGEARLKSQTYNDLEAETYFQAILAYVANGLPGVSLVSTGKKTVLSPRDYLVFELKDGLGGHSFQEHSIKIIQDDVSLPVSWNPLAGLLTVHPVVNEQKSFSIRIFARNQKGNALHPRSFHFQTEKGVAWKLTEQWADAFNRAEKIMAKLKINLEKNIDADMASMLEHAIHLYQLSLELQATHAKARLAEEGLLFCFQTQRDQLKMDTNPEIQFQKKRLEDFYPVLD